MQVVKGNYYSQKAVKLVRILGETRWYRQFQESF